VLGVFSDPAERARAVGLFGGLAALGGTVSVVLSGVITELTTWRVIFLVNLRSLSRRSSWSLASSARAPGAASPWIYLVPPR
jgi:MFS family permease